MATLTASRCSVVARSSRMRRSVVLVRATAEPSSSVGNKVEKWLKTPFDLLAFGPRAATGALLSFPERIQSLQTDVEKALELLQDPRPLDEKQAVVLKEVEDTLVEFLERGATVESDVLANVKAVLPPEAASALAELIPEPPSRAPLDVNGSPVVHAEAVDVAPPPPPVYYGADVQASQVVSEMTEIKNAVGGLKTALDAVRTNADVAATNMLRLNLREARDQLARRVAEVSPATQADPSITAATREARILLEEVDAQFFPAP